MEELLKKIETDVVLALLSANTTSLESQLDWREIRQALKPLNEFLINHCGSRTPLDHLPPVVLDRLKPVLAYARKIKNRTVSIGDLIQMVREIPVDAVYDLRESIHNKIDGLDFLDDEAKPANDEADDPLRESENENGNHPSVEADSTNNGTNNPNESLGFYMASLVKASGYDAKTVKRHLRTAKVNTPNKPDNTRQYSRDEVQKLIEVISEINSSKARTALEGLESLLGDEE